MSMKIAILHSRVKIGAKRGNLRRMNLLIKSVLNNRSDVDVVVLPSYPISGPVIGYYPPNRIKNAVKHLAERISNKGSAIGPSIGTLLKWSTEYGIHIIAGPIIERAGPKLYLAAIHISPMGGVEAKYRKISLTRSERDAGLSPGKSIEVFEVKGKGSVGIFIDEDLGYPEIFRAIQSREVNIILGFMLPYDSSYFRMVNDGETGLLTMDLDSVLEFLAVRSRETGLPIILVGGGVEGGHGGNHGSIAFMPTIPAEPDIGVVRDRILDYNRLDSDMVIDIDTVMSRPRALDRLVFERVLKELCK